MALIGCCVHRFIYKNRKQRNNAAHEENTIKIANSGVQYQHVSSYETLPSNPVKTIERDHKTKIVTNFRYLNHQFLEIPTYDEVIETKTITYNN